MRKFLFISTLVLAGFVSPSFAQEKMCTEMACVDGLTLTVDPARKWVHGKYEITLLLDNKQVTCKGQLPLNECEKGPTFECNFKGVTITESGCALPEDQQGIGDIHIDKAPAKVMVRITRNYRPMLTRTIIAKYQTLAPNGPGCGPVCRSASYDLFTAQ